MKIIKKNIPGVYEIISEPINDNRGYLSRLLDDNIMSEFGLNAQFCQESLQYTKKQSTVRGLHVSLAPSLEGKTVTAISGSMQWIFVDVRKESEYFGNWESVIISKENQNTLYVERGFAHGCVSLTDDVTLLFRADNYFNADNGTGVFWGDNDLGINWKLKGKPIISDRDSNYGSFQKFKEEFVGVEV
jgi:dTDP-4-dehydrorhamnose 3,5-epimerase